MKMKKTHLLANVTKQTKTRRQRVSTRAKRTADRDVLRQRRRVHVRRHHVVLGEVGKDLLGAHLRVKDRNLGALVEQVLDHVERRRLARVARVSLERKAEQRNALAAERGTHDAGGE